MPAARRQAKRSEEYARREALWNEQKQRALAERKERFGRRIIDFDAYGKPLGKGEVRSEGVIWSEVARGLELAANATGDPLFADALTCLKAYGLDQGSPKRSFLKVKTMVFGDRNLAYLENMNFLLEHRRRRFPTLRAVAEEVASAYFYDANSFDAAVQSLRKRYSVWQRAGFPPQPLDWERGDLGSPIRVRPVGCVQVPLPTTRPIQFLADEGITTSYNTYWRRRFRDGDVWIAKALG